MTTKEEAKIKKRFWEIDFWRGIAVICMIIYHLAYNLTYFGPFNLTLYRGPWLYFQRLTASSFLFLVGLSLSITYDRDLKKETSFLFHKYLKRGLKIFSYGLLITLVTWLFMGELYVRFGILHCIGVSIILAYPFLAKRSINWIPGVIFIITGWILHYMEFPFSYLLWLGLKPHQFYTIDYFPLLPWFGIVLIGTTVGKLLYPSYKRAFSIPDYSHLFLIKGINFLGQHSLLIYLIHQPIILLILFLLGWVELTTF
ncbi:MAG: hypothetical protein PWP04_1857 [Candidatus Atribacteria bacterium]|nr:hypothetical protein [Candidatus Atribacteria bacterium]